MPENVSKSHDVFYKARRDFINITRRTESMLKKEKAKLLRQLKRTNTKISKQKDKLVAAEKRLEVTAHATTKQQVRQFPQLLANEKQMASDLRESIRPLSDKLVAIKDHVISARYFERGLAKIDKEIDKHLKKSKAKAAKKTKKKSVKKRTVKKKAVKKKAVKKKAVKKKAVKKKAVKKKAAKKKAGKK